MNLPYKKRFFLLINITFKECMNVEKFYTRLLNSFLVIDQ